MVKERETPTGSSYRPRVFVPLNSKFSSRDYCFHIHDCFAKRFPLRSDFGLYETQRITFRLSSHHCLLFFFECIDQKRNLEFKISSILKLTFALGSMKLVLGRTFFMRVDVKCRDRSSLRNTESIGTKFPEIRQLHDVKGARHVFIFHARKLTNEVGLLSH